MRGTLVCDKSPLVTENLKTFIIKKFIFKCPLGDDAVGKIPDTGHTDPPNSCNMMEEKKR